MPNTNKNTDDTLRKLTGLQRLLAINTRISSTQHFSSLLKEVIQEGKSLLKCEACSLMLLDHASGELYFDELASDRDEKLKDLRVPLGKGIAGHCAASGETTLVNDVSRDTRFYAAIDKESGFTSRSILCVPLRVQDKTIGILEAINPEDGSTFDRVDVEIFEAFTQLAAIAIEKIRAEKRRQEQKRLEYDLDVANHIQQNFLPRPPHIPGRPRGFAANMPAREIGGDFYDFIKLAPTKTGILIGDVSGKGVSAALYMVKLLSDFRWQAVSLQDIGQTLTEVNKLFFQANYISMFATLIYLVYNHQTGEMEYTNAGHNPFLILNRTSGRVQMVNDGKSPPLGVYDDITFKKGRRVLQPEEEVILITDGVVEATSSEQEEYGLERLVALVENSDGTNTGQQIMEAVIAFSQEEERADDITVVTF